MAINEQIISLRRDSIVSRTALGKGKSQVCKSYKPEDYPEYQKLFGADSSFMIKSHFKDVQSYLYSIEVSLLRAFSGLERKIVPKLIKEKKQQLKMCLEDLPYPTYRDKFLENITDQEQKRKLTSETIEILVDFHKFSGQHLDYLKKEANPSGKNRLKQRGHSELAERWRNYLQVIIYQCSEDLEDYWQSRNINPEETKPKTIRRHIRKFLEQKGIDLASLVKEFIGNNQKLTDKEKIFIHGDFGPQNIFYTGDKKEIKICDFDKARLAYRDIDLISTIYNIHMYPFDKENELFSSELVKKYFMDSGLEVNIQDVLARMVASRLKENIRLFAVYCQMNQYETEKFVRDSSEFSVENGEFKTNFLEKMFKNHFRSFLDYYRYREGEGWELLIEKSSPDKRDLVKRQLEIVENLLKDNRIIRGTITNQKRAERWKRILTYDA